MSTKICNNEECDVEACMGFKKNEPLYCIKHGLINRKYDNMNIINVIDNYICDTDNCYNVACMSTSTWPPILCKNCGDKYNDNRKNKRKEKRMANIIKVSKLDTPDNKYIDKVCIICYKSANCKDKDGVKLYCTHCAKDINKDLDEEDKFKNYAHKICIFENCNKSAVYKHINNDIYTHCKAHKSYLPGDKSQIICKHELCNFDDCDTIGIFLNKEDNLKYCKEHIDLINNDDQNKYINVKNIYCNEENCDKRGYYKFEKSDKLYCKDHKQSGMINTKGDPKICQHKNCTKISSYNFQNEKEAIFCKEHKDDEMIDVKHKTCNHAGCTIRPNFNFKNNKSGIYCIKHKTDGMINVTIKKCILCNYNNSRSESKFKYYCTNCFYYTFPESVLTKNHKTKENTIFADLLIQYPDIIRDKIVTNGCSRRRPDGLIQLNDYNVIIEVDEDQHVNYDCENKRVMEIFQDLGNSPLTIIRFNPDSYIDKDDIKQESLFKTKKKSGKLVVRNKSTYDDRLKTLLNILEYSINNIPNKELNIINLFYDGY